MNIKKTKICLNNNKNNNNNNNKVQNRGNKHTDRCGNTRGQECHAKGSGKEVKHETLCVEVQRMWKMRIMCRGTANVENENYD